MELHLNCGCVTQRFKFVVICNQHKSDRDFLASGAMSAYIGKRVRLCDNKEGERWKYAGRFGIFRGPDPEFPMDVIVQLEDDGILVYASPDDIEQAGTA